MNYKKQYRYTSLILFFLNISVFLPSLQNDLMATCPAPENFIVEIQGNNALLTWDPVPGATAYKVGYFNQNDGSSGSSTTTGTSYTFMNLPPGIYQFWVMAICEDEESPTSIIEAEEIDGAIPETVEDLYNCLCDSFNEMAVEENGSSIEHNWNIQDDPCLTQYEFNTSINKTGGGTYQSSIRFTYDPVEVLPLINDCQEENTPGIDLSGEGPGRKYVATDKEGKEMYEIVFEDESFKIKWNEDNVDSFTFDINNCVFCPDEGGGANPNSEFLQSEAIASDQDLIKIHPNPFTNDLKIEWKQSGGFPVSIKIYNASGQLVAQPLNETSPASGEKYLKLDTHAWPVGIYFVVMNSGLQNIESKFIKIR